MPRELKGDRILRQIKDLQTELNLHQNKCRHPKNYLTKKNGGATGFYDPQDDHYWTDYHCSLCAKKWRMVTG